MKSMSYSRFLVACMVSTSIIAGHAFAQEAAPALPPVPSATQPAAPAPVAAPVAAPAAAPVAAAVAPQQAAPASDPWQQEFALWQAAANGNSVEEYQGYLTVYPNGKFAPIAQARIVKLSSAEKMEEPASNPLAQPGMTNEMAAPTFTTGTPMEESVLLSELSVRREVQGRLTSLGFSTGGTDGVMGARSRTAISQWQTVIAAPVSGYLSYDQLAKLRADSATVYPSWLASRPKPAPRVRRSNQDELVGRVPDNSADAAIALGMLGLAAGVIGGAAMAGGRHHGGPRFHGGPGPRPPHHR